MEKRRCATNTRKTDFDRHERNDLKSMAKEKWKSQKKLQDGEAERVKRKRGEGRGGGLVLQGGGDKLGGEWGKTARKLQGHLGHILGRGGKLYSQTKKTGNLQGRGADRTGLAKRLHFT